MAPVALAALNRPSPRKTMTLFVGTYTDGESRGIYRCRMDLRTGALEPVDATGGIDNPSHLALHPTENFLYAVSESTETLFTYRDGTLQPEQNVSSLPEDFEGENYCADLHVSADGRFVYGSNRGHDSLVVYAVDNRGALTSVQHVSTQGAWPRNFAIDPSGRFQLVANQRSDNVVVFTIDADSGRLAATGETLSIPSPVCIRCLSKYAL